MERDVAAARERGAGLEVVVAEKNALLSALTELARTMRNRAEAAEARARAVDFVDETALRYQRGATKRTTPLLEPVTGRVAHVGAPLRHVPPHSDATPGPPLKHRLQAQLRRAAARRRELESSVGS